MTVDYELDMPQPRPISAPAAPMAGAARSRSMADAGEVAESKAFMRVANETQATVEAAPFQAIFTVPGKLTVLSTGEQKRVQLDEAALEPILLVRTVPRVNPKAFLYTKLTAPKTTPYLPGQVSLFRDGTFAGTGRLPQLAPGEEFELGFGPDDAVRVRHAIVDEKRGESGIISSSKTDVRNFRISVKNLHERPIQLVIQDQIPVSQQQDIKVDLVTKTAPTKQNIDDKRGVLAWESTLAADQEQVLDFGYRVQWPAAKRVHYGR